MSEFFDGNGKLAGYLHEGDASHPLSYRIVRDNNGQRVRMIYGNNPKNPRSVQTERFPNGKIRSQVYGEDLSAEESSQSAYNADWVEVRRTYANNPHGTDSFDLTVQLGAVVHE